LQNKKNPQPVLKSKAQIKLKAIIAAIMIFIDLAFISGCSLSIAIIAALNKDDSESIELKVESNPSDAEVYLDGKKLGTAPIAVRIAGFGIKHEIEIAKNGYQPKTATVFISFCDTQDRIYLVLSKPDGSWSEVKDNILSFVLENKPDP